MTDKPKTLYHGSQSEITDGFIRMRPGHINGMQTPITAAFATPSYRHARLYAAMRIISNGWKWPKGIDTLYVERISPNISNSKAYVYEVSSDGFIPDGDDYYCLNDVPILKTYEIDVMQEIRNGTHDDITEAKEQIRMLAEAVSGGMTAYPREKGAQILEDFGLNGQKKEKWTPDEKNAIRNTLKEVGIWPRLAEDWLSKIWQKN